MDQLHSWCENGVIKHSDHCIRHPPQPSEAASAIAAKVADVRQKGARWR